MFSDLGLGFESLLGELDEVCRKCGLLFPNPRFCESVAWSNVLWVAANNRAE